MQKTLVMIKPDGVRRKLIGEIIGRFEARGLNIHGLKLIHLSRKKAEELYSIHRGKPFFGTLVDFVISGPVVVMVLSGPRAIEVVRTMMGATDPIKSQPGTIRGDFALEITENIIHAADSEERAEFEISLFFNEEELVQSQCC
ncbi:MAG: nucleoside-diphosphate kinase [Actinomycetota bacterium]|nr:nucleoside-diphosphate kinase [Actinomycetota bacterium]MDI6821939.1 nucleoside-diphosphate kinase [Actinomycetota bacterium]